MSGIHHYKDTKKSRFTEDYKRGLVDATLLCLVFLFFYSVCMVMIQLDDKSPTGLDEFNDSEIIQEYLEQPSYTPIPDPIEGPAQLPEVKPQLDDIIRLI